MKKSKQPRPMKRSAAKGTPMKKSEPARRPMNTAKPKSKIKKRR